MSERFDAIVVGAGPAGSTAALVIARAGYRVLLLERGEFPGSKNVSGAAFYAPAVLDALIPRFWESAPVERYLTRRVLSFMSPESSFALDCKTQHFAAPPYNAFTIIRPRFDRWLANQAVDAGATLLTETVADDVLRDGAGRVSGVRVRREGGDIEAPIVIAADGVNAFLAKHAGLQREFAAHEISLGVKEVLALGRETIEERFGLTGDEGTAQEYIGSISGPVYGGAFLYTNRETLALGVIVQLSSLAQHRVRAYDLLECFKAHPSVSPLVRGARLVEYSAHMIPEAGWKMLPRLYTDGMLVAGDAAALCFATGLYLEGINYAIASGAAAGATAVSALQRGDTSARSLSTYEEQLKRSFVLRDLHTYRVAPSFINAEGIQNIYPLVITSIAEQVFRSRGEPKRKLLPVMVSELRRARVPVWQLIRDLWEGGRAFLW
jgi:electron transfer flavoprotein-quinone oxidoreductase